MKTIHNVFLQLTVIISFEIFLLFKQEFFYKDNGSKFAPNWSHFCYLYKSGYFGNEEYHKITHLDI